MPPSPATTRMSGRSRRGRRRHLPRARQSHHHAPRRGSPRRRDRRESLEAPRGRKIFGKQKVPSEPLPEADVSRQGEIRDPFRFLSPAGPSPAAPPPARPRGRLRSLPSFPRRFGAKVVEGEQGRHLLGGGAGEGNWFTEQPSRLASFLMVWWIESGSRIVSAFMAFLG